MIVHSNDAMSVVKVLKHEISSSIISKARVMRLQYHKAKAAKDDDSSRYIDQCSIDKTDFVLIRKCQLLGTLGFIHKRGLCHLYMDGCYDTYKKE